MYTYVHMKILIKKQYYITEFMYGLYYKDITSSTLFRLISKKK